MRHLIAILKFVLRLTACFGIAMIASLAFTRLVPVPTAFSLIRRISLAVGMYFVVDFIQAKIGKHVNETVDTALDGLGYPVTPHPLDKF